MKSVLISIQPKWCELIASGKKTVEVRKTRPKIKTPFKCYIYCTNTKTMGDFILCKSKENVELFGLNAVKGINKGFAQAEDIQLKGKVIGEFVCDRIQKYECEFVDDDCYEGISSVIPDEDGEEMFFLEYSNDSGMSYEGTDLYRDSCVLYSELKKYMGVGFGTFYGWHISDLVIYEQPRELGEFFKYCGENPKCEGCEAHYYSNTECGKEDYCCSVIDGHRPLKRPPQSWCYVVEKEGAK